MNIRAYEWTVVDEGSATCFPGSICMYVMPAMMPDAVCIPEPVPPPEIVPQLPSLGMSLAAAAVVKVVDPEPVSRKSLFSIFRRCECPTRQ